jgi:hypothetical protein
MIRLNIVKYLSATIIAFWLGVGVLEAAPLSVQEAELDRVWREIQTLKISGADIPQDLYTRYFEIDRAVHPDRNTVGRTGSLDQGLDGCPGTPVIQPLTGEFVYPDAGTTQNYNNDCPYPRCRNGKDVMYSLVINHAAWIEISTCGSGFDTYLCIYKDSCCVPGAVPFAFNDDAPAICGTHTIFAGISQCFVDPGTYYIVLDGYNTAANGQYALSIRSVPDSSCGNIPEILCPADYSRHEEGTNEAVCEFGTAIGCGAHYCGLIDRLGDLDVYTLNLTESHIVEVSVYGNDTPGRSGFHHGLNPSLSLWSGPSCDHPLYRNKDFQGTLPAPVGRDSRIVTRPLPAGTYWVEVYGDTTAGPYEFTLECRPPTP